MALENVVAMSLSKSFLTEEIFPKYPEIGFKIRHGSEQRYMKNVKSILD
jgi:hypothetical protein